VTKERSPAGEAALLAAGVFAVYAAGACRTIYVGDSGELVAAAATLGIPHPSGYPLYVLLGKLWTLLVPVGSVAFRMSLFSAAGAAAACGVVFWLCRRLGLHAWAAATAALLLAFSPSFWGEANIQRVYALNALFVALATAAAFAWHRSREPRALVMAFFLCGLGATNHTFMAIVALALALFAIATAPALVKDWRTALRSGSAFAVGLLPYAYLPLRSRADPPLDWGNPETLASFLDVVLRRDFWGRAFIRGPGDLPVIAWDYLRGLEVETLGAGALLALVGAAVGWRRRWPVLLPLLVMAGNLAALAVHGSRTDIFIWHRYYIPSYLMAAVLAGMGAQVVCERLPRRLWSLPIMVPLVLLLTGWRDFDRSRYRIAEDFSRVLLSTLPPGAHLSASDDNILFVLIYLHLVEGARPDLDLILQGVGDARLPPLRFNPDTDPLFLTHHPNWSVTGLQVLPVGLAFQTIRAGGPRPPLPPLRETLDGETDPRVPKDYLTQNLIGQFHYMRGLTCEPNDWPRAWREFEIAARAAPGNDVLFYNLGLIYRQAGLVEEALAAFERSHAVNPRPIASISRADATDRVAETRAERDRVEAVQRGFPGGPLPVAEPGRAEWHRQLARWLEARGEAAAARGHWLRALVLDSESARLGGGIERMRSGF
jgi:tetratricopeptide (TPR) repeat protein